MRPAVYSCTLDSVALRAPRFPTLTLDERQLTPALGFIFDVGWLLPGESMVSILWKFARVNGLPGHTLVQLIDDGSTNMYWKPCSVGWAGSQMQ
jgi:hypothetical protein